MARSLLLPMTVFFLLLGFTFFIFLSLFESSSSSKKAPSPFSSPSSLPQRSESSPLSDFSLSLSPSPPPSSSLKTPSKQKPSIPSSRPQSPKRHKTSEVEEGKAWASRGTLLFHLPWKFGLFWNGETEEAIRDAQVDEQGNLWVLDPHGKRLLLFNEKGQLRQQFQIPGTEPELFRFTQKGEIAILDSTEGKLFFYSPKEGLLKEEKIPRDLSPITDFWVKGETFYLERAKGRYFAYSFQTGKITPIPGPPVGENLFLNPIILSENTVELQVYRQKGEEYEKVQTFRLPLVASTVEKVSQVNGNYLLLTRHEVYEGDTPLSLSLQALLLSPQGKILKVIPLDDAPQQGLVWLEVRNGIYQIQSTPKGLQVSYFPLR